MQPEWFTGFLKHLSPVENREATLLTLRVNGRLRALLPLMKSPSCFKNIPARTLRSLSSTHSCRFDIIHGRQEIAASTLAFWKALKARNDWDVIEALDVPQGGAFERLLLLAQGDGYLVTRWPTRRSPFLPLPSPSHDPFDNCPTSTSCIRLQIQDTIKSLQRLGSIELHITNTAPASFLSNLVALDARKNRKRTHSEYQLQQVYSHMIHHAATENYLHAYSLLLNKVPIAMHIGLLMNNRYFILRFASDEAYASFLPDHILMKLCIKDLCRRAVHTLDFLGTEAPWNSVWTRYYRPHAHCYILRPTLKGYGIRTLLTHIAPPVRRIKRFLEHR
jgi:CelD/BcsL family acetyltransferase involved in cellulose biosynthesis